MDECNEIAERMTCNHEYVFGLHEFATIPTCLKCSGRETDNKIASANARINHLEALLKEAPHDAKCYSQTHCGVGGCIAPPWAERHNMAKMLYLHEFEPGKCNCFKSRA